MKALEKDSASLKVGIVVNVASGSATASTAGEVERVLADIGVVQITEWSVGSEELDAALKEAGSTKLDVLVVFGGDGTIRTAASTFTMDGPVLIPLPGGTMNLLPKALYGNLSWEDVLRTTFTHPSVRTISGGRIGEEKFFIAAIVGAPALWSKAREALRDGALGTALEEGSQALSSLFASKINYHFNELHEGSAEAVSVICPLIATTLADDRQVLEAAVIDVPGAGEVLELATAAAFGEWRDSRNVAVVNTKKVTISSETDIPLILDGEMLEVGNTLDIEFMPEAFQVLVPGKGTKFFLDFDRTIFDTPAFKQSIKRRPTLVELLRQAKEAAEELFGPTRTDSRQRMFMRTLGTFMSHGRFLLSPEDLKAFLYPDVLPFLESNDCTIVTYGVSMFIRAKVTSALAGLPVSDIVYTSARKGRTIRRLTEDKEEGPFVFIDDADFQLASVAKFCPDVTLYEMRRDGGAGDGRFPVVHSLDEVILQEKKARAEARS